MTEIILHSIDLQTGDDATKRDDPFTGCETQSILLDEKEYTNKRDANNKLIKVTGANTLREAFIINIEEYRNIAKRNPHKKPTALIINKKLVSYSIDSGWCKDCFNRVAKAVGERTI